MARNAGKRPDVWVALLMSRVMWWEGAPSAPLVSPPAWAVLLARRQGRGGRGRRGGGRAVTCLCWEPPGKEKGKLGGLLRVGETWRAFSGVTDLWGLWTKGESLSRSQVQSWSRGPVHDAPEASRI